ncbi:hypothetical protein MJG53_014245 [Ovis ammon polii x Ovis aries]|uniref:Uncharacterized protein n=1 Tax=Ovis ammon polii x Ovis aries TaxID=2918886 RepID=A0ACB9UGP9_9CETA|nr:hypothetical protein MJG53_014245 [Ovis ammon polii x Ovis aries]
MTRGNQRELAPQKNMKKQSNSVKGKRPDDRLSAAAHKQRDSEIMPQKQKKANEKKEEPSWNLVKKEGKVSTRLHFPTNKNKASNMIHKQLMESSVLPYTYFLERKVLEKEIILAHVIFSAVPMAALGSHANPYLTPSEWISDITSYDTWMTEEHPFQDHRLPRKTWGQLDSTSLFWARTKLQSVSHAAAITPWKAGVQQQSPEPL